MNFSPAWPYAPLGPLDFHDVERVRPPLQRIAECGASADLVEKLLASLRSSLSHVDDPDVSVDRLSRFIEVSRSPTALLALFERDQQALPALLQVLATSPAIADLLIRDPESFDLIRASDGRPAARDVLIDELLGELQSVHSQRRAALTLRQFAGREILRIAYGEFVRGQTPDRVQRQLSHVHDAVLQAALAFALESVTQSSPVPQRIDGTTPRFSIIALGNYGGQETGYGAPLDLLLLCDQIDRKNASHVAFHRALAAGLVDLLASQYGGVASMQLRFVHQPIDSGGGLPAHPRLGAFWEPGTGDESLDFYGVEEAAVHYERANRTWQRLALVKSRYAAGDEGVAQQFLSRISPWVYHQLLSRSEITDIAVLRRKLERRAAADVTEAGQPIADVPGGRHDIELTVQFLQLLHGSELPEVRVTGTVDAIAALQRHGCLTHQEASILSENHARLCRLEHHLAILFDHQITHLPTDPAIRERLAWRLGVRTPEQDGRPRGDTARFESILHETFNVDRKIINHLMVDDCVPADNDSALDTDRAGGLGNAAELAGPGMSLPDVAVETELILDPDPDPQQFRTVLGQHHLQDPDAAIDHLVALSRETVSFLSPRRCRHFFAAVAPRLLNEISQTPDPDLTLARLVDVTDSIGAKATLWELLRTSPATLRLMVRLCALAPYLTDILVKNPGMIDELIDSLVMDRMPSAQRLDAQSARMCESVDQLAPVLRGFKASAHLMIGVRDLLDKEPIEVIGRGLSDTSEACVRRAIERQQNALAARFGDPVDQQGDPVELIAVALGKFGGQETNYLSDLDLTFLYTADGQTRRRVGGPRSTLANRQFFNLLVQNVLRELDGGHEGRIEQVDLPFAGGPDKEVLTYSVDAFLKPFRLGTAGLWQRLMLCKARPVSGQKPHRDAVAEAVHATLRRCPWRASMMGEIRQLRLRSESTAGPLNLKRGTGGAVDIELIALAGVLQAIDEDVRFGTGTIAILGQLQSLGRLSETDGETLIANYRELRRIEAKLRLLNVPSRHELPLDGDGSAGTSEMHQLAALLGEPNPESIVERCDEIRRVNRELFHRLIA